MATLTDYETLAATSPSAPVTSTATNSAASSASSTTPGALSLGVASETPQTAPTDPLETPLSPANSPRNFEFDEQNHLVHSGPSSLKPASSSLHIRSVNDIIITNLTTPSVVPGHLTTAQDIYNVINSFSVMPQPLKRHVLFKLLQSCDRASISSMMSIMNISLRHDILSKLPNELASNILGHLDVKSLCTACTVSRSWRDVIDSSQQTWKKLLQRDEYTYTKEELKRAQDEKWDYVSWGIKPDSPEVERWAHEKKYGSLPSLKCSINIYKAIYRRKVLIQKNWMDPNSRPYHLSIPGDPHDVVTCLQFDEDKIIIGSDDHTITIYDTATGEMRAKLRGHENGVWALKYVGNTLVSGSTDRSVRVWDIENKRCTHIFHDHGSTVRCLDIMLPQQIGTDNHGNPIMAPKQPLIVTGSRDTTIKVWKLPEADPNREYTEEDTLITGNNYLMHTMIGHTSSVRAISGYGELVVSGSYDHDVRVWVVETGECRWVLQGHEQRVYSVVIDPKRNRCISGSMDWFVKLWSLETGAMLYSLQGHTSLVGLVDLNRSTIVSAAADCTLCVWNPDNGALLHTLKGHKGVISSFQHDELKVISGSEKTLKLWNIQTGELVRDLLENMHRIWQVRFDQRRCVAVVMRDNLTSVEVLDFDYDPYAPREPNEKEQRHKVFAVTTDNDDEEDRILPPSSPHNGTDNDANAEDGHEPGTNVRPSQLTNTWDGASQNIEASNSRTALLQGMTASASASVSRSGTQNHTSHSYANATVTATGSQAVTQSSSSSTTFPGTSNATTTIAASSGATSSTSRRNVVYDGNGNAQYANDATEANDDDSRNTIDFPAAGF